MAIQTLIADDELLARQKLRQLLRNESDIEVVGEASSAREVCELVRASNPQLMFLDVQMPGMDGLELVSELSLSSGIPVPRVILTTAYEHYAVRAFELNIADYLLKPFGTERLRTALTRVRGQIQSGERKSGTKNTVESEAEKYTTRIVLKSRGRILFLPVCDIRWISAEENYVRICTGAETHLLRQTMTSMEQRLNPQVFLRVHRSAIVNLEYVKEVRTESGGDFVVHLVNGQKLGMSRTYHSRISEFLEHAAL